MKRLVSGLLFLPVALALLGCNNERASEPYTGPLAKTGAQISGKVNSATLTVPPGAPR
jgi:hypothetical protein